MKALELWGGIECSTSRIGDDWRDQVHETGHRHRPRDLDQIAALGIRTLRYPLAWESVTPGHPLACGWDWHDARLRRMRHLEIDAVAGLLHHGSGPRNTDLLDPDFPDKLAAHAARAAARYPWIMDWTPVNEPLTTARFSCLYGIWYPHEHSDSRFLQALVNQCRAVLLSMRAIRRAIPGARLLQTEDLGRVFATEPMRAQADYENDRRWLSLDLLSGRVDLSHPWRQTLEQAGVSAHHLDELATGEATPDLVGINHYVTSDRFLDHRQPLYPAQLCNGRYADTEAARVGLPKHLTGWYPRLLEAWNRYRLPLVVSEAHLSCDDPDDQVRWLMQAWEAVHSLRAESADVRAVTVWALFGLVDWDSMLRERRGSYEPGVFDVRHDPPSITPLGEVVRALADHGFCSHPSISEPGWWQRDDRIHAALRRS